MCVLLVSCGLSIVKQARRLGHLTTTRISTTQGIFIEVLLIYFEIQTVPFSNLCIH